MAFMMANSEDPDEMLRSSLFADIPFTDVCLI